MIEIFLGAESRKNRIEYRGGARFRTLGATGVVSRPSRRTLAAMLALSRHAQDLSPDVDQEAFPRWSN